MKQARYTKGEALLTLLTQINAELISRRQPEYLYTAAAIAAFGAVSWGVATLTSNGKAITAIVAGAGIALTALIIIWKIKKEHKIYVDLRNSQIEITKQVISIFGIDKKCFPENYFDKNKSPGFWGSILIVALSALASVVFCLLIALDHKVDLASWLKILLRWSQNFRNFISRPSLT